MLIYLKSGSGDKKYKVVIHKPNGQKKTLQFGSASYSDYTIHKDKKRKEQYIARHKPREDWTKFGIETPGFWARWLLWNKPSLSESISDIQRRFNVRIVSC